MHPRVFRYKARQYGLAALNAGRLLGGAVRRFGRVLVQPLLARGRRFQIVGTRSQHFDPVFDR